MAKPPITVIAPKLELRLQGIEPCIGRLRERIEQLAMKTIDEAEAKRIVRCGLESWIGTLDDFKKMVSEMYCAAHGVNTIEKREKFIGKFIGRHNPRIYAKKIKIGLSHDFAIGHYTKNEDDISFSKSEKKKITETNRLMSQYLYRLSNKSTYIFVVKDGSKPVTTELILQIFTTRENNKKGLFSSHSVGVIKKHCLERLVQRLGLESINGAIEEILPAVTWLEGSGSELAGRAGGYGDNGMKRHVPTPNGALLLHTGSSEMGLDKPVQECSLITWIHRRQFKRNQEVTVRDFKYATTVNYQLSSPKLSETLSKLEEAISSFQASDPRGETLVTLHGERYSADDFLLSLKQGKFLDFLISFEKDTPIC